MKILLVKFSAPILPATDSENLISRFTALLGNAIEKTPQNPLFQRLERMDRNVNDGAPECVTNLRFKYICIFKIPQKHR